MTVSTSCQKCVFAEFDDNKQVGCELGRLDIYREHGIEVSTHTNDEDSKEAFLIVGRICTACRDLEWGEKNPKKEWRQIVEKQMDMRYLVIIVADSDTEALERSIKSVANQELPSTEVVVVRPITCKLDSPAIIPVLKKYALNSWKISHELANEDFGRCIDRVVDNSNGTSFYTTIPEGTELETDLFSTINHRINQELLQFSMLEAQDGTPIFNTAAHMHLDGNYERPLQEKIKEVLNAT